MGSVSTQNRKIPNQTYVFIFYTTRPRRTSPETGVHGLLHVVAVATRRVVSLYRKARVSRVEERHEWRNSCPNVYVHAAQRKRQKK